MPPVTVLIASPLEPEHAARIAAIEGVRVLFYPALLPQPRYQADHTAPLRRSENDERRWREYLAQAEVLFDFDHTNLDSLKDLIPRVKWIQATSTGIGQLLVRTGLIDTPITFTTARGTHARPLADFVQMSILWFAKGGFRMIRDQAAHRWERYCGRDLTGMTAGLVGFGSIGREVAVRCRAMGMRVVATKRTAAPSAGSESSDLVDAFVPLSDLPALVRQADFLVLAVPHTSETERLIGKRELDAVKPGAMLINIARGVVVDEQAMIAALQEGRLGGVALDVFAKEPLPTDSPLWDMPNVLVSPHSASTIDSENARLTDLFCENLRRYLRGEALINVFDKEKLY
jgi:phosphoglycerate dehydrogenase-like enzyme